MQKSIMLSASMQTLLDRELRLKCFQNEKKMQKPSKYKMGKDSINVKENLSNIAVLKLLNCKSFIIRKHFISKAENEILS
jgi:hypothetical protein